MANPHSQPLDEAFLRTRGLFAAQRDLLELLPKAIEGFAPVSQSDPDQELSASELDALVATSLALVAAGGGREGGRGACLGTQRGERPVAGGRGGR